MFDHFCIKEKHHQVIPVQVWQFLGGFRTIVVFCGASELFGDLSVGGLGPPSISAGL